MKKTTLKRVQTHALKEYPREACGLILDVNGREVYHRCKNLAHDDSAFVMDPKDYAAAEDRGEVVAIVHSHPEESARPSEADRVMVEETGLPWVILSIYKDLITQEMVAEEYTVTEPTGYVAPLVGRMWSPPKLDCYGLVRDYYRMELGLEIPDFELEMRSGRWWENAKNESLYLQNFEDAGFVRVDGSPKEHDVVFMTIGSKAGPNHAGIYLGDATGHMLHHLCERISNRVPYGGYWLEHTHMIVRHRSLL